MNDKLAKELKQFGVLKKKNGRVHVSLAKLNDFIDQACDDIDDIEEFDRLYQSYGLEPYQPSFVVSWRARNMHEFYRAVELGVIEHKCSYTEYEQFVKFQEANCGQPIQFLDMSPDEVIAALKQYGLPNTSEARTSLYMHLHCKQNGLPTEDLEP